MAHTLLADAAAQAEAVLGRSSIFDLRHLAVEQDAECLCLRGRVGSFYHKQLAQELVRTAVDGVEVVNAIQVVYRRDRRDDESDWLW